MEVNIGTVSTMSRQIESLTDLELYGVWSFCMTEMQEAKNEIASLPNEPETEAMAALYRLIDNEEYKDQAEDVITERHGDWIAFCDAVANILSEFEHQ